MFVFGNLLIAVAQVLNILLTIYLWIVIIRSLITWVSPDPYNPIVQFLYRITDPALRPIQRYMPALGGIDLSPLILILLIFFIQSFFVTSLIQFGRALNGGAM
ncbi:Cell division integral membrane protein, YggT and half-length relatives [hydrothermal vent metagenome]|uniref:Cell division integral membrane protein, YggT and half-length relatives n=1 Tax=hydrothermal vent metagenome TaxID=652676 RepID=A0A3B1CPL4_9ZZZZ